MKDFFYGQGVLYEDDAANNLVTLSDWLLRIVVPLDYLRWNLCNQTLYNHCHTFSFSIYFMSMQLSIQFADSYSLPLLNLSHPTMGTCPPV